MNEKLISELKKLNEKRTPGEWVYLPEINQIWAVTDNQDDPHGNVTDDTHNFDNEDDIQFIVAACNAVPELIKEIENLNNRISELENSKLDDTLLVLKDILKQIENLPIPQISNESILNGHKRNPER